MMIEINFKFQGKDNIIKSSTTRLFKDICEEFAKKVKADLDYLIFIYHDEKINLEMDYYVGQQFNLEFESDNKRVDILVYQEIPFNVIFKYQGIDYVIGAKETEKIKVIFKKFEKKGNISLENVFMIYSGNNISDEEVKEKTLSQVINEDDRGRKAMNISVYDLERNSINSVDNIKIYNPVPQNANNDNDNSPNAPLINEVDNIDNDNNQIAQSINEIQEDNLENNNRNENSNCFFKFLENLRPVYIILIQIGVIILFVGIGCLLGFHEYLKNNEIFLKVICIIIFGICGIMSMILAFFFRILKSDFKSKWWYIYYIYYIPIIALINYIIAFDLNPKYADYKLLLVYLFIRAFALVPVIILKRKKLKLFVLLALISNVIIILPLAILWIELSNITILLSLLTFFYDIYLGFVYHYSDGLGDDKISVLMYDYGFFGMAAYGLGILLYPLYWLSKKCIESFNSD